MVEKNVVDTPTGLGQNSLRLWVPFCLYLIPLESGEKQTNKKSPIWPLGSPARPDPAHGCLTVSRAGSAISLAGQGGDELWETKQRWRAAAADT